MGKKDANFSHCQPVDQYRKQIGKQDWKKSKKDIKKMKARADQQTELTPQKIVFWMGTILVLSSCASLLFFWYMGAISLDNLIPKRPV